MNTPIHKPYLFAVAAAVAAAVITVLAWSYLAHATTLEIGGVDLEGRAPRYCERFPSRCRPCDVQPCGEPIGLVCCEQPLGCFGVHAYSDCDGDIYSCEWGYQGRNADGSAYVECFDE